MRARFCLIGLTFVLIFTIAAPAAGKKHSPAAVKKHSRAAVIKKQSPAAAIRKNFPRPVVSAAISRDPYIGAIVVDAASGRALFEDNADGVGYPASVTKLMDLLLIMERLQRGSIKLTDSVTVAAEAANVGGSQAYLRKKEIFTVDELLYALMIKSANDAAAALAIHVAGSQEAFVELMNREAGELGMTSTHFQSVHGLPPRRGISPDKSTPRDLSLLARAVLKYPYTLRYTATKNYALRNGTFNMGNHNHLLGVVEGCDGLKTGYFSKAGFSIVATARNNNVRIIAIVLGSRFRLTRDREAKELLDKGFLLLPPPVTQPIPVLASVHASPAIKKTRDIF